MNVSDLLTGTKVLEVVHSPINGELTVIRDLTWGTYIKGGGLTQSGGVAKKVWETSLNKVKKEKTQIQRALVLGLGGGAVVEVIRDNWPDAKVIGVDIDEVIVDLGKKYLSLNKTKPKIIFQDAYDYVLAISHQPSAISYDLICIDIYLGDKYPKKFEDKRFLELICKLLTDNGVAVFNRLYYDKKRNLADRFQEKLEKVFNRIETVRPEANIMYICSA